MDRKQDQNHIVEKPEPILRPVLQDITVVIVTLGRSKLEGYLYSIAEGNRWPAKIIVVDQGANPQVINWVKALQNLGMQIYHVPSSQTGVAAAANRGFDRVRSHFVAVTHDDCRVETDWLQNIAVQLHDNPEAIITGRVEPGLAY